MKALYTATASVTGGRHGHGRTDDGRLDVALSMPKEIGGSGGEGTNPEQLFALAYAACFESALRLAAQGRRTDATGANMTARVSLLKDDASGFQLQVELEGRIPGLAQHEAEELLHAAHETCPYSKATRGNIEVKLIAQPAAAAADAERHLPAGHGS